MAYRLKRDLPFAKAGAGIVVDKVDYEEGNIAFYYDEYHILRRLCRARELYRLNEAGWIEEVKPRELYVEFFRDTNKISDSSFDLTYLRNDARFYTKRFIEVME